MSKIAVISRELFYTLTGALIVFSALELIKPDIVLGYLNLSWLLIIWLFDGILLLMIKKE